MRGGRDEAGRDGLMVEGKMRSWPGFPFAAFPLRENAHRCRVDASLSVPSSPPGRFAYLFHADGS